MTREHTVTLDDERKRLDTALDDIVETLAEANSETATARRLMREARDLDQAGRAVDYLIEGDDEDDDSEAGPGDEGFAGYDPDATVTVRELDGEAWGRVEDRVATMASAQPGSGGVPGSSRNVYAAAGLVDAPFLNGVGSDVLGDKADAVASLTPAPGAQKWLESLVDDVGSVDEGNWQPLAERFAARANSTADSS